MTNRKKFDRIIIENKTEKEKKMRALTYVGKDKYDTIVKTTSFEEMKFWKTKGFEFKEVMEDITEEKKVDTDRIAKVRKKMGL